MYQGNLVNVEIPPAPDTSDYLKWATDSFLLATAIAEPKTSIHTHMCYCDFGDCMEAIDRLDADVNSIENGALLQTGWIQGFVECCVLE